MELASSSARPGVSAAIAETARIAVGRSIAGDGRKVSR